MKVVHTINILLLIPAAWEPLHRWQLLLLLKSVLELGTPGGLVQNIDRAPLLAQWLISIQNAENVVCIVQVLPDLLHARQCIVIDFVADLRLCFPADIPGHRLAESLS